MTVWPNEEWAPGPTDAMPETVTLKRELYYLKRIRNPPYYLEEFYYEFVREL
jgi:hypothetical protein